MVSRERREEKTTRFLTDRMLGKLSIWLRILGHDTVYAGDINILIEKETVEREGDEDKAIVTLAKHEARILLTRDKNLASYARKKGVQCVQIKTDDMMEQLKELLRHSININLEPVPVRCSECNARIRKVEEGEEDILREKNYVPTSMICVVSLLFHPLLLKRYATANNPANANTASNPSTPFSSGVGNSVGVTVGVDVSIGIGIGVGVGVGVGVVVGIIASLSVITKIFVFP